MSVRSSVVGRPSSVVGGRSSVVSRHVCRPHAHALAPAGRNKIGRDLGQWHKHKRSLAHARVWYAQIGAVQQHIAIAATDRYPPAVAHSAAHLCAPSARSIPLQTPIARSGAAWCARAGRRSGSAADRAHTPARSHRATRPPRPPHARAAAPAPPPGSRGGRPDSSQAPGRRSSLCIAITQMMQVSRNLI